ncbi:MAG: hypothetical protein ABIO86_02330 [Sphingomonas sp.]
MPVTDLRSRTKRARSDRALQRGTRWAASLIALGATGCTHLAVSPDRIVTADHDLALPGATYSLPMLQYDVTVTRTLTACPTKVEIPAGADGVKGVFWTDDLAVDLGVTAVANQISGERYRINYSKLDSWMKTTSFTIEYQPGGGDLLKSVNVSVEDHSGEVVGNVVKAGLAVASVAAGPAGAAGAAAVITAMNVPTNKSEFLIAGIAGNKSGTSKATRDRLYVEAQMAARREALARQHLIKLVRASSDRRPLLTCADPVRDKIAERDTLAEALKGDNEKLTDATAAVEALTKLAAVRALNATRRAELSAKAVAMLDAAKAVADGQKAIARIEDKFGVVKKDSWPKQFKRVEESDLTALKADEIAKFTELLNPAPVDAWVINADKLARGLAIDPELDAYREFAKDFVAKYVDDKGRAKVFRPREPLAGCASATPDPTVCVASLTTIQAKIAEVESDNLPLCKADPKIRECLTRYKQPTAEQVAAAKKSGPPIAVRSSGAISYIDARADGDHSGLFLRPPVRATLTICRKPSAGEVPTDGYCAPATGNLVKDDKVLAPQLGQLRYFRLVNEPFSNNGLVVSLTRDGAIEKFQYASTKSIAQGLSAAAADAATQGTAFDKQRRDDAAKNNDPVAALQKQIDLKTAQQKLAAFDAVKTRSELEEIQIAKARADLAYIQAETAFTAAQAAIFASQAAAP